MWLCSNKNAFSCRKLFKKKETISTEVVDPAVENGDDPARCFSNADEAIALQNLGSTEQAQPSNDIRLVLISCLSEIVFIFTVVWRGAQRSSQLQ